MDGPRLRLGAGVAIDARRLRRLRIAYRSSGDITMNDGSVTRFDEPVLRFIGVHGGRVTATADIGVVWKADAPKELVDAI